MDAGDSQTMIRPARMSKKNKRNKEVSTAPVPIKPRQFSPRACTMCEAVRPAGTNFSRVYSKHGDVRYCRCGFCGNTWTQTTPRIPEEYVATTIATNTERVLADEPTSVGSDHGITTRPIEPSRSSDRSPTNGRSDVVFDRESVGDKN